MWVFWGHFRREWDYTPDVLLCKYCMPVLRFASFLAGTAPNMFTLPLCFIQAEEKHAKQFMNFKTGQSPEYVENYVLLLNDAKAQKAQWNLICSYYILLDFMFQTVFIVLSSLKLKKISHYSH